MTTPIRRFLLVLAAVLSLAPPALGAFVRWGGWPPGFGVFPPQVPVGPDGQPIPEPGFSLPYFCVASAAACVILAFLLFPTWFGFQPGQIAPHATATTPAANDRSPAGAPWWTWAGLALNLLCWGFMWFSDAWFVKYLFTPLWWGFILVLDGIVYARNRGASILSRLPREMLLLIAVSIVGWFFFEWLNYFVMENWVYPNSPAIFPDEKQALFWFTLTYTCVWPAIFEWYTLLRTFPALRTRWAVGPSFAVGKLALLVALVLGALGGVAVGIFPYFLFFVVWLGSLLILPAAMGLLDYWTPFTPIARGNWSPAVLCALGAGATGFFWEFWNHGSNAFLPGRNPNFWVYDIPYVNVIHLFSEMPLLGYFGYLPFGLQCWAWWLVFAHVFEFSPDFDPTREGLPGTY